MQLQVHARHTCRKGPKVWAATWFLYMIGCRCPQGYGAPSTARSVLQLQVKLAIYSSPNEADALIIEKTFC
jgi:hypothetical protein